MNFFSENFRALRNFAGLTQAQLADQLSIETATIAHYETGKRLPSIPTLLKVIKVFNVSLDYFIVYDKNSYPGNLRLLKLAQLLDQGNFAEEKTIIKGVVKILLGKNKNLASVFKQDSIDIALSDSFNENTKNFRILNKMTQSELGEKLNISKSLMAQYELNSFPPLDRLADLSGIFNISIHALVSGELLHFDFDDSQFGDIILKADHFLSLEDHNVLIRLMEAILKK